VQAVGDMNLDIYVRNTCILTIQLGKKMEYDIYKSFIKIRYRFRRSDKPTSIFTNYGLHFGNKLAIFRGNFTNVDELFEKMFRNGRTFWAGSEVNTWEHLTSKNVKCFGPFAGP
jgi:hypothetical protein